MPATVRKDSNVTRIKFYDVSSHLNHSIQNIRAIHSAIATIITFSVSETKPRGTFDDPPTQAHFSSRFST